MAFDVFKNGEKINQEPLSLAEATDLVKLLVGRLTTSAFLASQNLEEELFTELMSSRDSITIKASRDVK
jgi:hypothetical protein